ncbi:MAG TPA: hypothetical protein DIT25_02205 [Candidatus Moranbacteria bacterium]|nr:hypothetical protein [Candidatus Moranbacteria bacterium]
MNDTGTKEINKFENFDAIYARELEVQRDLEKIEVAYVKTVEKYGEYSDLKSFAEYLRTMEKLFQESKFRNRGFEQSRDEMIQLRIKLLAKNSAMDEDVLNAIHAYFKQVGHTAEKIYAASEELLEKYKDDPGCREFILYIRDIFINFFNAEREQISMDELKNRLIKARMEALSGKGDPDLLTLENIYKEFNVLLKK